MNTTGEPAPDASTRDAEEAGVGPDARLRRLLAVVLVAITLIAYRPALTGDLLWDDESWTIALKPLLSDFAGLLTIWLHPTAIQQPFPLTATTFWLDYHLWEFWTAPYHLENVLLHALSALLFWRLLRRLDVCGAWLAAAVFALHPLMVESGAWIAERKNVLSLVLSLGAVLAYGRFTGFWTSNNQPRNRSAYVLALVLFLGALLSKTTAVTLPAVLLLLAWWKRGSIRWRADVVPALPFFALAIALGLATAWLERSHLGAQGPEWSHSLPERLLIAGRAFWFYVGRLLWPAQLCFVYPRWQLDARSLAQWIFPVSAGGLMLGLWLARGRIGRGPAMAVFFFAGTLLPVSGFFNIYYMRYSFVCDHWAYLSSLGLLAGGAALVARAAQRMRWQNLPYGIAVVLLPLLAWLTWKQCAMYANVETLWRTTLDRNPKALLARNNLGLLLQGRGQWEDAVEQFQKAIELQPDFAIGHNNLGYALLNLGKTDDAIASFEKALAIQPDYAKAHNNLGEAFAVKGQWDEAISQFEAAVRIQPAYPKAQNSLGLALIQRGRAADAIPHFQAALQVQPDFPEVRKNLAYALSQIGNLDAAIAILQQGVMADPSDVSARNNLGIAYFQKGLVDEAVAQFQASLTLSPDYMQAQANLARVAWVLATAPEASLRNGPKALELASQADRLSRGTNPTITGTLAAAYAETGRFAEAIAAAQRAAQLADSQSNDVMVSALKSQLESYQANKPWRDAEAGQGIR